MYNNFFLKIERKTNDFAFNNFLENFESIFIVSTNNIANRNEILSQNVKKIDVCKKIVTIKRVIKSLKKK